MDRFDTLLAAYTRRVEDRMRGGDGTPGAWGGPHLEEAEAATRDALVDFVRSNLKDITL